MTGISPNPSPPPLSPAPAGWDNRRAPRIKRRSHAQLILYPPARHPHALDVSIVDYSATGIGIIHSEGLLVGQSFVVREPVVTRDNTCLFTVVRSDPRPDGTWSIGLHVQNTLQDELDDYVAPTPAPGVGRKMKLIYLALAIVGLIAVVATAMLYRR